MLIRLTPNATMASMSPMEIAKMVGKSKIKRIRGHVEVHAEAHWADRGDGSQERVIDVFRVQHRDGSVEFANTASDALAKIVAFDDRARRKAERKNPAVECIWITTIEWHDCGPGFEPPAMEIKS